VDSKSGCGVDINLNSTIGIEHTSLIKGYLQQFKSLKPLLLVLKYFLHQKGLNHPYTGGIGSYGLTLLLVNFFEKQRKEMNTKNSNEGIPEDLGNLLMDFLFYYGNDFDFSWNVVSVSTSDNRPPPTKKDFPEWASPRIPVVVDPIFTGNNVTRTTFRIMDIKSAFYDAYVCLRVKTSMQCTPTMTNIEPILSNIIYIPDELISHRNRIEVLYGVSKNNSESEQSNEQRQITSQKNHYRVPSDNRGGSNHKPGHFKRQNHNGKHNKNNNKNGNNTNTASERNFKNGMKQRIHEVPDQSAQGNSCLVEAS